MHYQTTELHAWQQAGLGIAPFECVELSHGDDSSSACQTGYCAVCGTRIQNNSIIRDDTGKCFAVGCVSLTCGTSAIAKTSNSPQQYTGYTSTL